MVDEIAENVGEIEQWIDDLEIDDMAARIRVRILLHRLATQHAQERARLKEAFVHCFAAGMLGETLKSARIDELGDLYGQIIREAVAS